MTTGYNSYCLIRLYYNANVPAESIGNDRVEMIEK